MENIAMESKCKNVILVDGDMPNDWDFKNALEIGTGEKWNTICVLSNKYHGWKNVIRYLIYFLFPFYIFIKRRKYKKILAWQQFYGLILAFYFCVFKVRNTPDITIMTFIYKAKSGIIGRLYSKFMKYIVSSKYICKFIVFSSNEKKYYAEIFDVSESRFAPIHLGLEDMTDKIPAKKGKAYYLSAGRSNRDYKFLIKAWQNKSEQLKIIYDDSQINESCNIEILNRCYGENFYRYLAECFAVIVPLKNRHISSGQLVVIQSMMYGKPCIVTKNKAITEYIENEKNGLIIEKTQEELEAAIEKMKDEDYYNYISKNARDSYEKYFGIFAMGIEVSKII